MQCSTCKSWLVKKFFKLRDHTARSGKIYTYYDSLCTDCWNMRNRTKVKEWKELNRTYVTQRDLAKRRELRAEFNAAYGGKCSCCGERRPEFLTTEHINGRTGKKRPSYIDHANLKRAGWPKGNISILCFNCNSAKGVYGSCPHTWTKNEVHTPLTYAERNALYKKNKLSSIKPRR